MGQTAAITTVDVTNPACCVEFSRLFPQIFVIGTYLLHSSKLDHWRATGDEPDPSQIRSGELIFYRLSGDEVEEGEHHETSGAVLDLHFRPQKPNALSTSDVDILGAVTSTGHLEIYALDLDAPRGRFVHRYQVANDDVVITSLAWRPSQSERDVLAMTLSSLWTVLCDISIDTTYQAVDDTKAERYTSSPGEIWCIGKTGGPNSYGEDLPTTHSLVVQGSDAGHSQNTVKHVHDEYPWIAAFDHDGHTLFSGDDGGQLAAFKISKDWKSKLGMPLETTIWNRRTGHDAGVTAILSLGDFVLTGSYDYSVRIYLQGMARTPVCQRKFGETIWRLKLLTDYKGDFSAKATGGGRGRALLLATCMREGTRILEIVRDGSSMTIEVLGVFNDYAEQINYASDAIVRSGRAGEYDVVSVSFYGRKMCLWRWHDDSGAT